MRLEACLLRHFVVSMFLLTLGACTQQDSMQKYASSADRSLARHYIDLLRARQFEEIERSMDPMLVDPSLHRTFVRMAASIPAGEPTSVTLVGVDKEDGTRFSTLNLAFEYDFSGKWLLINVQVKRRPDGTTTISGFSVHPQPSSLEQQGKYVPGKTSLQYAMMGLVILLPLLALGALGLRIRTKLKAKAAGSSPA
jgi:hypothetical protein